MGVLREGTRNYEWRESESESELWNDLCEVNFLHDTVRKGSLACRLTWPAFWYEMVTEKIMIKI